MERGNRQQKSKGIDLNKIVNSAIGEGIDAIINIHPRFSGQEELLSSYIDKKRLNEYINESLTEAYENKKFNEKDFVNKIAGYVASGKSFKEKGKEIILRESFEKEKHKWFSEGIAREVLNGEKYLDKTMGAFKDLYSLFKTGEYAQRMPKLAEAVGAIYDMGFADAAVNILYENNLMNKSKYKIFKKAIKERVEKAVDYTQKGLEEYILPQKAAAIALGFIGAIFILTNNNINGNIIGIGKPDIFGILGGLALLLSGIWMYFRKK